MVFAFAGLHQEMPRDKHLAFCLSPQLGIYRHLNLLYRIVHCMYICPTSDHYDDSHNELDNFTSIPVIAIKLEARLLKLYCKSSYIG